MSRPRLMRLNCLEKVRPACIEVDMQHDHVLQAGGAGGHVGNWVWSRVPGPAICKCLCALQSLQCAAA